MKKNSFLLLCGLCTAFSAFTSETLPVPDLKGSVSLMDIAADEQELYFTCALEEEEKQIRFFHWKSGQWEEILTPENAKAAGFLDLELVNAVPYLLFNHSEGLTLAKYHNSEWKLIGKYGFAGNSAGTDYLQMAFCQEQPFIIFRDREAGKVEIWTHEINGALSIWTTLDLVGENFLGGEQPLMCAVGTHKLIAVSFQRSQGVVNALSYDVISDETQELNKGIPGKNVANLVSLKCVDGKVYLAYEDRSKSYAVSMVVLDPSTQKWTAMDIPGEVRSTGFYLGSDLSIGFRNDSRKPVLISRSGTDWKDSELVSQSAANTLRIASSGGSMYYAFLNSDKGNQLTLLKF